MCEICESNKKLGIPNYLCLKKIMKAEMKETKLVDLKPRKCRGEK